MLMIYRILTGTIKYDGSQIAPLWAYDMGIEGDSIVIFHGPMDVTPDNMKDLEDRKAKKTIRGDQLIHIIVERFDSPASMRLAYYMQRLLIVCIKDTLDKHGIKTIRNGDDLFIDDRKLTVSIASAGVSSEKIHCGINITTQGTPDDVKTAALEEFGIKEWETLAQEIARTFVHEYGDIESDIVKTKSL
ncbi:hypothetical protein ANME2D_01660 [Candidatus Methanoperedens nitroreducens]|uniref:DUF366 domain-containing protein n=2 Tax=Candidatus Methanoperedens nitratireducens TaxID=1392998 RepID=A0A062VA87_9EURY|nr:hypothetical protein ANME2D_01660 [Candidatus Methanoperedens nitroreducens]